MLKNIFKKDNLALDDEVVGVVYRTRDKKVMKSINYFSPDLEQFFTYEELIKTRPQEHLGI